MVTRQGKNNREKGKVKMLEDANGEVCNRRTERE